MHVSHVLGPEQFEAHWLPQKTGGKNQLKLLHNKENVHINLRLFGDDNSCSLLLFKKALMLKNGVDPFGEVNVNWYVAPPSCVVALGLVTLPLTEIQKSEKRPDVDPVASLTESWQLITSLM